MIHASRLAIDRRGVIAGGVALLSSRVTGQGLALPMTGAPLNFLVVGDWGRDGGAFQRHVARHMADEARVRHAEFVISTGDNFYNLGVSSVSDSQWDSSFERIYADEWLQKRWYPVLGNHDYGGSVAAQVDRTGRGPWFMPDRWYSVSGSEYCRPDLEMFFIDTPVWVGRETFPYAWLGTGIRRADQIAQTLWLTEKLLTSSARYKLVFGHHPIFSVGKHGGIPKMLDLDRLFRRTGVTAYICGHDHCLYHIRSPAMDYLCSGGGSQELSAFSGVATSPGCVVRTDCPGDRLRAEAPRNLRFVPNAGFASVTIGDDTIAVSFIDRHGATVYDVALRSRGPDASVRLDDSDDWYFEKGRKP